MIQSAQVISLQYDNQKRNYLNATKAAQSMVGRQLLVSTSLINPSGTSIIDQHVRRIGKVNWLSLEQSGGILIVFFSIRFQRTRSCNYGIPRLSQNKMKRL